MLREALHEIRLRLWALVHRRRFDRDLEDEMAFHLAMRTEKYRAAGLGVDDAEAAAQRRFGRSCSKEAAGSLHLGATLVFVVVAGLAAYLPAARASGVDPLVALRSE